MLFDFLTIYLILINIVAIVITICDKLNAKFSKRRVPENTLLVISLLGGSIMMYLTMQLIRHKTRKRKFMVGIPLIIVLQILLIVLFMVTL